MTPPKSYGRYHWAVKVPPKISKSGEIILDADSVHIRAGGELVFESKREGEVVVMLALSQGNWLAVYAASALDSHPVAVTLWEEEL